MAACTDKSILLLIKEGRGDEQGFRNMLIHSQSLLVSYL